MGMDDSWLTGGMLFFWGLAYSLGLVMVSFLLLVWIRTRDGRARATLVLMVPFSLLVFSFSLLALLQEMGAGPRVQGGIVLFDQFMVGVLIFAFPFFGHEMAFPGYRSGVSRFWAGLAGATVLVTSVWRGLQGGEGPFPGYLLLNTVFTLAIGYSIATGVAAQFRGNLPRNREPFLQSAEQMALTGLVFLPAFVCFDFFYGLIPFIRGRVSPSFTLLPLFYMIWALNLIYHMVPLLPVKTGEEEDTDFACRRTRLAEQSQLTDREREVLGPLTEGASYKEISHALYISLPTVKTHVCRIYGKTGCAGRAELIHRIRKY